MDKKKGYLSLLGIVAVLIAGIYMCIFGVDENAAGSAKAIKQGLDLAGGVSITYEVVGEEEPSPEDMADTIYKLQKRVEVYSTEALVYQEGNNRINIEIPGVSDANTILEELGKPGSLIFMDEFDAFYHFELAESIVAILEKMPNTQVILTSHNTNLLTNKIMRPDCYFILTKDKLTAIANATTRELREGHNLEKLYMSGEFNG